VALRDFAAYFLFSRQYVHLVITDLIAKKKEVIKIGGTRNAFYVLLCMQKNTQRLFCMSIRKNTEMWIWKKHTVLVEMERKVASFERFTRKCKKVYLRLLFSEMLNNAIEHSGQK